MTAVLVVEAVVIVLLLILVAGLLKSHAEILRQLHRLGIGEEEPAGAPSFRASTGLGRAPAAEITGVDPTGAPRVVTLEHGRGNTLLAFLSSGCASCQVFWEELSRDYDLPTPETRVVIVTKGEGSESPGRIAQLAPPAAPLVMSDEVWDLFRVPLTPYFLLIDGQGQVLGEGSATSWERLLELFRRSQADEARPTRLDTRGRSTMTDSQLTEAGIEPGDDALYRNPVDG